MLRWPRGPAWPGLDQPPLPHPWRCPHPRLISPTLAGRRLRAAAAAPFSLSLAPSAGRAGRRVRCVFVFPWRFLRRQSARGAARHSLLEVTTRAGRAQAAPSQCHLPPPRGSFSLLFFLALPPPRQLAFFASSIPFPRSFFAPFRRARGGRRCPPMPRRVLHPPARPAPPRPVHPHCKSVCSLISLFSSTHNY